MVLLDRTVSCVWVRVGMLFLLFFSFFFHFNTFFISFFSFSKSILIFLLHKDSQIKHEEEEHVSTKQNGKHELYIREFMHWNATRKKTRRFIPIFNGLWSNKLHVGWRRSDGMGILFFFFFPF